MTTITYSIDESPGTRTLPWYGLQHVLTMLGATVAVPSIVAGAYGLDSVQSALLISNVLLAMGIATFVQVYFGSRLPIVQGSSFAFLPALLYVATIYSGSEGLAYASGAIFVGGILQFALGFTKVAGALQRILTPVVVGPTIMVIGLSLFSVGGGQASSNWLISSATIIMILLFSFGFGKSMFSRPKTWLATFPVILAVGIMWSVCLIASVTGLIHAGQAGHVDLSQVFASAPLKLTAYVFPWGIPKFDASFLLIFAIAYLVSTVESIGDYNAINEISRPEGIDSVLDDKTVNRGVMAEGFGCFIASLLGSNPTTSYSENIGVIGITGVASRKVIIVASAILFIAGLLPVVGAVLATIPEPIMGGLYCVLFGMITGVGLRYAAKANLTSMRNVSIMGFAIFIGFAIPSVFASPAAAEAVVSSLGQGVANALLGIVTSNMAMTALSALLLDQILGHGIDSSGESRELDNATH